MSKSESTDGSNGEVTNEVGIEHQKNEQKEKQRTPQEVIGDKSETSNVPDDVAMENHLMTPQTVTGDTSETAEVDMNAKKSEETEPEVAVKQTITECESDSIPTLGAELAPKLVINGTTEGSDSNEAPTKAPASAHNQNVLLDIGGGDAYGKSNSTTNVPDIEATGNRFLKEIENANQIVQRSRVTLGSMINSIAVAKEHLQRNKQRWQLTNSQSSLELKEAVPFNILPTLVQRQIESNHTADLLPTIADAVEFEPESFEAAVKQTIIECESDSIPTLCAEVVPKVVIDGTTEGSGSNEAPTKAPASAHNENVFLLDIGGGDANGKSNSTTSVPDIESTGNRLLKEIENANQIVQRSRVTLGSMINSIAVAKEHLQRNKQRWQLTNSQSSLELKEAVSFNILPTLVQRQIESNHPADLLPTIADAVEFEPESFEAAGKQTITECEPDSIPTLGAEVAPKVVIDGTTEGSDSNEKTTKAPVSSISDNRP